MAVNRARVANRLLAALPREEYRRLVAGLEPVTLTYGEVIYEQGKPMGHVYFPSDALVALLMPVEGHMALEVGLVGREGMLGVPVALGMSNSPVLALVHGTGTALRMSSTRFRDELGRHGPLQGALNRYIYERMVQVMQIAACNRFHLVEGRLARRLLMTRDRMGSNDFHVTQEILGNMLGVLRVAVTKAASALQRKNLIRYRRGNISILDGAGLEAASCRCYQVVKKIYGRARSGPSRRTKSLAAAAA